MLHWYDELPSTQDVAHRLAAQGAPHGSAVAARVQTAGRGTRGRTWLSPRGGLWLSVVCRPGPGGGIPVIGIRIGLSIAGYLDALLLCNTPVRPSVCPSVRLKWPNDLMLDDRKLGGILCEARWQGDRLGWVTVGLGLNLHNPLPPDAAIAPVALSEFKVVQTAEDLAQPIADRIAGLTQDAPPLSEAQIAEFSARDWLRGREIRGPVRGTGVGITPEGKLCIRGVGGSITELDQNVSLDAWPDRP